jgi:hypothetical protein
MSRCSVVSKRMVCVSLVCSPRSSNSSIWTWFWKVYTNSLGRLDLYELLFDEAVTGAESVAPARVLSVD